MRWMPAGLVAALLACPVHAPADATKGPRRAAEQLVAELGDPVYSVRENAQRELWLRGDEAIPALEKAARGEDPEAARRARELLDKFAWGIRPDTPPAVLKLVRQFQAGDPRPERVDEVRKQAITDLLKMGRTGVPVVRAILKKDIPPESRAKLALTVTTIVRREVPALLVTGKVDEAGELVSLHAAGTTPEGAADFAAYHALRGDLPAVIAQCEANLKAARRTTDAKLVLTHLYRAAGLWARARGAAADLPRTENDGPSYKQLLLEDEGNWPALADLPHAGELNHPDAMRLSLLRLSGRKEKFDEAAKKLRSDADELSEQNDIMDAAVALLANHRAADATDLLIEKRKNLGLLSEILIARMRYKDALDLIGPANKDKEGVPPAERLQFNLRRARVLMLAGRRDAAVQLFEEVARGLKQRASGEQATFDVAARTMVRTELRVGLRDLACEHASLFIGPELPPGAVIEASGESPFELLFPFDPTVAEVVFDVLRANKVPGDKLGPTMVRVRDLLNGTASAAAVDQAVKLLREAAGGTPVGADRMLKSRRYFALAQVCRVAKRGDEAASAFKTAAELTAGADDAADAAGARSWVYGAPDPARVWLEWGDHLAESGRDRDAANVFEAGWKLFPDQPLPLFLSGQSLVKVGDVKEGGRRIELSHWVSLGNERLRGRFLDELVRRGETKAIRREIALILKACWSRDHFFGNVMNQCARGANLVGDYALAEQCGQRSLMVVLRTPGVYFVDAAGYLGVPHDLLVYHARAQLAAGKPEAMDTARQVLTVTPGHLELVCGMVPELDRANRKKDADELFQLAWGAYQKMLADYPDSPSARHALAVLAAHGRRKLDDGLKYAKAAVASDPASPLYREALAEVRFRLGNRAEAVKLMQELADEQPRHSLYRRQLARYRAAAFDSPWPYTVGD